jgi:dTDP-4-dehydrorhamnose 3,5-epimerase
VQIKPLKLQGTYAISSERRADERGFFMRSYDRAEFETHGLCTTWEQESLSFNRAEDTIRGLHFQLPPLVETKMVRVLSGSILDVFVDLRADSETYGKWDSIELSAENGLAVYIPAGFAHGFRSLAADTLIEYKIDVPYVANKAGGVRWNDDSLAIDWGANSAIISERDAQLPFFTGFNSPF